MQDIVIPLMLIPDQNKMISSSLSRNGRFAYASERRKYLLQLQVKIELQIRENNFEKWEWPGILTFNWQLSDYRRDPDNISSAGRKFILDAMQKAIYLDGKKFLANDNLKHIIGFKDEFQVHREWERKDEKVIIHFLKEIC